MLAQVGSRVVVLAPLPDNSTAILCVIPARYHPVQLTTQAGSTPRQLLLISFCKIIKIICTSLCTRYVHKEVQSSNDHTWKVTHFLCFCL